MKLTIGMIVKNEEKWLDKCLSAIKPILDNVDSELIITDSGSTDHTLEIAHKYTDKVLHFDWINDFSAARNTVFPIAKGEWFMVLDADDIFESCDETISFFNSGEYKKYNSATYISRNLYNTANLSDYSDLRAQRLCKILPKTRYINPVHEYLSTFGDPIKNINDVVLHYGYATDGTVNILEKKQERNSQLLLKRLELEGDTNELLYVQLFECFSAKFDHARAYEYLERGRKLCIRKNSIVLAVIYAEKARLEYRNNNFTTVLDICELYFEMDEKIRPHILTTDAEMNYLKAMSLIRLDRENDAFPALCGLFDIYTDVIFGKLTTEDAYLQSYEFATENNYVSMLCVLISCCIKTSHCDVLNNYLNSASGDLVLKCKDISAKRKFELSLTSLLLADESADISHPLGAAIDGKAYKTDKLRLLNHISDISENDIIEFTEKYGINENPDMIAIMLKKGYDVTALFGDNMDMKTCALECCKHITGFYELAENYAVESIKNKDKLPAFAEFIGLCINVKLIEDENKSQEYKEKSIEKLFMQKNNINALYNKYNQSLELARLAAAVKQNIRAHIANGNIEAAQKTIDDYRKIAPNDPEADELYKMAQVKK